MSDQPYAVTELTSQVATLQRELDQVTRQRDALRARILCFEQKLNDPYYHTQFQSVRLYRENLRQSLL